MRAISPVIATVIIVSVAIAISIAVALWLTGITSGFTQTENLQIVSSYAEAGKYNTTNTTISTYTIARVHFNTTATNITLYEYNWTSKSVIAINITKGKLGLSWKDVLNVNEPGWLIKISIKNTGTVAATIDNIFVNNIPIGSEKGIVIYNGTSTTINPGESKTLYIFVYSPFSAGQMVNIKIHTASGRDYPATITLP